MLGLGAQDGATITFYAIWDYYPTLEGEDIYVSLEEAKKGKITEEWLSTKVRATDLEDGVISYGIHGENKFYLWDYSATDFTSFRKGGYVTETFRVVDSAGNSRKLRIKVYIIESRLYDETVFWGVPRFISKKYYKTEVGGLWEDSVWRLNMEYKKILDSLFEE